MSDLNKPLQGTTPDSSQTLLLAAAARFKAEFYAARDQAKEPLTFKEAISQGLIRCQNDHLRDIKREIYDQYRNTFTTKMPLIEALKYTAVRTLTNQLSQLVSIKQKQQTDDVRQQAIYDEEMAEIEQLAELEMMGLEVGGFA